MAEEVHLKKSDMEKIYKFVHLIKQRGIEISQVILFGSYAKGIANPDSDIDIVIVSTQFGRDNIKEMMLLRKIALKVDSHIEPVPLSPQDFSDHYSTFIQEIKKYGKDIEDVVSVI